MINKIVNSNIFLISYCFPFSACSPSVYSNHSSGSVPVTPVHVYNTLGQQAPTPVRNTDVQDNLIPDNELVSAHMKWASLEYDNISDNKESLQGLIAQQTQTYNKDCAQDQNNQGGNCFVQQTQTYNKECVQDQNHQGGHCFVQQTQTYNKEGVQDQNNQGSHCIVQQTQTYNKEGVQDQNNQSGHLFVQQTETYNKECVQDQNNQGGSFILLQSCNKESVHVQNTAQICTSKEVQPTIPQSSLTLAVNRSDSQKLVLVIDKRGMKPMSSLPCPPSENRMAIKQEVCDSIVTPHERQSDVYQTLINHFSKVRLPGFTVFKSQASLKFMKLYDSEQGLSVAISVTFKKDLTADVFVHRVQLPALHEFWEGLPDRFDSVNNVMLLLGRLMEFDVCVGNANSEFTTLLTHPDENISEFTTSMYLEGDLGASTPTESYSSTVRANTCPLLVKGAARGRCLPCKKARSNLKGWLRKQNQLSTSENPISSTVDHSKMSRVELERKCSQLKARCSELKRKSTKNLKMLEKMAQASEPKENTLVK